MLELATLGLLKDQPMHGYQLSRELGESLGGFWRVSYGSLYPTLRRLERDGAVESVPGDQASTARRKNVYRITETGEKLFFELLQETPGDNSSEEARFRVRLAFFRYLPPETRIRLFWSAGVLISRTGSARSRALCGLHAKKPMTIRWR